MCVCRVLGRVDTVGRGMWGGILVGGVVVVVLALVYVVVCFVALGNLS